MTRRVSVRTKGRDLAPELARSLVALEHGLEWLHEYDRALRWWRETYPGAGPAPELVHPSALPCDYALAITTSA